MQDAVTIKEGESKVIEPTLFRLFNIRRSSSSVIGREEAELRTLPTINVECPNCGNNKAYVWLADSRFRRILHPVHALHKMQLYFTGNIAETQTTKYRDKI